MKNFAVVGVGGYIAPRHLRAIKDTGNKLVAALDPSDSVGVLDSYFDDVVFFTEFERFDRYAEKLRRLDGSRHIDMVSVCSPNYLHDAHCRFALRIGADAICEKPLVINPWNLDALQELEIETGQKIYNILQLRLHPALVKLREQVRNGEKKTYEIDLSYITSRGNWYLVSWKGDAEKSGGVATNIGIHFFDMLMWIFGKCLNYEVHVNESTKMAGFLELEHAKVRWFLSVDKNDLPENARQEGQPTFRSITVDGEEIEFSGGFTDLHTLSYQEVLAGRGFGVEDARPSISLVYDLRNAAILGTGDREKCHPFILNR